MLYPFFWVNPRRLNFMCRHSGTLCLRCCKKKNNQETKQPSYSSCLHHLWRWNRQSVL